MKKIVLSILLVILAAGCASVPMSDRKQLNLVSDAEVLAMSNEQYEEFIKTAPLSKDMNKTALVVKTGRNISQAVERWLRENGLESEIANYSWEFNLVVADEINAFCMPGGKIVVYEGILPIAQDETGLAVIMGHEVAHAVAKHSNERISQQLAKQYSAGLLSVALALGGVSTGVQQLSGAGFEVFSQYAFLLPYSRKHELEADKLGLTFMAMAGYDPREAETFWERMAALGGGGPEFVSTHPSDETRIKQIRSELPGALKYYKGQ